MRGATRGGCALPERRVSACHSASHPFPPSPPIAVTLNRPGRSEAGKYTQNSRIQSIQTSMAERCLELLNFPDDVPRLILDIGCGSGLSGGACVWEGGRGRRRRGGHRGRARRRMRGARRTPC